MRKIILFIFCLMLGICSFAQLIQASLGPGSTSNRVKIYLKAAATQTPATISTLQFNLAVPATISPKPTMTILSHAFGSAIWQQQTATEAGYYHFEIFTPTSPLTLNTTTNTEMEVMEVQFTGGPNGVNMVSLVTLPEGGIGATNGAALFYVTGTLQSNGSNLFYTRPGVTVNNQFSYDATGLTAGTTPSSATLGGVVLPIKWLNFSAVRKSNDALVSWTVDNDAETEKYLVERSTDGTSFAAVNETAKRSGSGTKQYEFIDPAITSLGARVVYYRVKSAEAGNRLSYTETKNIRLDLKGNTALYPNPAKDGFTLTIQYLNPGQQRVQLHLVNALGQVVDQRNITRLAAANYYYGFQSALVLSGDYLLKIYEDGQLMETKRVVVKR